MLKNYLKTTLRSFYKNHLFTLINLMGLVLGISASIIVITNVWFEKSYDHYHDNADRIYRINVETKINNRIVKHIFTPGVLGQTLQQDFAEIENTTRVAKLFDSKISVDSKKFGEPRAYAADVSFFDIFSFNFMKGDYTQLERPGTVILTNSAAKKYFNGINPINKKIELDCFGESHLLEIIGVVDDIPVNSHLHFDFLVSLNTFSWSKVSNWFMNDFATYILLNPNCSVNTIESRMPLFIKTHLFPQKNDYYWKYHLQRLTDIHLKSDYEGAFEPGGNIIYIRVFFSIAVFILVMACINYINLSTTLSIKRAKEVGLRKIVGAKKISLILQFVTESVVFCLIALALSLMILEFILPWFANYLNKPLEFDYIQHPELIIFLGLGGILLGILSGIYPAFFLASYEPLNTINRTIKNDVRFNSRLRSGLVVFQFIISTILVICTVLIFKQIQFIQNHRLGFDKNNMLVIKNCQNLGKKMNAFKQDLLYQPEVIDVAMSSTLPGERFNNWGVSIQHIGNTTLNFCICDENLIHTLGMQLTQGRFFYEKRGADQDGIVLNETAVESFGWKNPLGKEISFRGKKHTVLGVVKDFHFESLHSKIRPVAMIPFNENNNNMRKYISIKMKSNDLIDSIKKIEKIWNTHSTGWQLEYSFLDDDLNRIYKTESDTRFVILIFSGLAILISYLGLFGLVTLAVFQRIKEIGIRKILGASSVEIFTHLTNNFIKWMLIANIFAWPIAWYVMHRWLQNFAYKTEITIWPFLFSAILTLTIAFLTVSYQAIKAAFVNPVQSLRYE